MLPANPMNQSYNAGLIGRQWRMECYNYFGTLQLRLIVSMHKLDACCLWYFGKELDLICPMNFGQILFKV